MLFPGDPRDGTQLPHPNLDGEVTLLLASRAFQHGREGAWYASGSRLERLLLRTGSLIHLAVADSSSASTYGLIAVIGARTDLRG
jgi:hypothetical protein